MQWPNHLLSKGVGNLLANLCSHEQLHVARDQVEADADAILSVGQSSGHSSM